MVTFNYELNFKLKNEDGIRTWIARCISANDFEEGELNYIFCDDAYLLKLNVEFLNHDTLTDIISFDYSLGKQLGGDIYISVERVDENAKLFSQSAENEINRVIIHGILHFMGFQDKLKTDKQVMREKEDECLLLLK